MHRLRQPLCRGLIAAALALQLGTAVAAGPQRWDLTDLYPTSDAWESAYRQAEERTRLLDGLRPQVGSGAAGLRQVLLAVSDAQREAGRLWAYASLQADEDVRVARGQERRQQMQALWSLIGEKTAWLAPAIQALGEPQVRAWLATDTTLAQRFDLQLLDTLRLAPHTLSAEGESLLAGAWQPLMQGGTISQLLVDGELPWPVLRLSSGKRVKLDTPAYEVHRQSTVRSDRKRVFDAFFGALKSAEGTLGATLNLQVLSNVYLARSRRYGSALEAALFEGNMPVAVYRQLVEQAHQGLPTLHRYLRLRQKMLGIQGTLAYYDNYPPLVPPPKGERFDLDRSKAITLAALAPLGDEYLGLLKKGFASRWVDSHPRPGKASGGYMQGGAYDVHPYLLLNHGDDYTSLSTVAHEWGHAVHSLLANANQPFDKAGYSTFIAESASIGNEMLLSDHLVAQARTPAEKRFYLAEALESIRTTFFRQVMFAEFQLAIHEEVEAGRPLSGPRLSDLYCSLAKRYYGEAAGVMKIDPAYCTEWAYISHFYNGFYVWQYASSMVGAAELTAAIAREGEPARERFVRLLKAGGSDYAYALYKQAGIDMTQSAPYQALMARMNRLMDEFEALAKTR
jgi:oligoendopeptidase F